MRILWILITGLALGVFVVMAIGTVGPIIRSDGGFDGGTPVRTAGNAGQPLPKPRPTVPLTQADAPPESTQAPAYAPARGADLPVPFHFWLDSYPADPDPAVWSFRYLRALRFYTADWGLPPEEPDANGALSQALTDHIKRRHPDRAPQFMATDTGCKVWIANPMAQETVSWDGACPDGFAGGEGVLLRTYRQIGDVYEAGYRGTMKAGKADGQGARLTIKGWAYQGGFRDGLFHGEGELVDTRVDGPDFYIGAFSAGFPHGQGRYESQGRVSEGTWTDGCLRKGDRVMRWVLRHDLECGYEPPLGGSPLRRLERWLGGDKP